MSNMLVRITFFCCCLIGCSISFAQHPSKSSSTIESLKDLYSKGEYKQAYALAKEHSVELEGDAEFDFYYGLAALQSGHYPEAQFTFERLITMYPEENRYRLEYARSLYHMQQHEQAKIQFEQVLKRDPPAKVQENIQRFLNAINTKEEAAQNRWSGFLGIGGGYDTNINNATALQFIEGVFLDETSRQTSSPFASARASVEYQHPITQYQSVNLSFDSIHKHNTETSEFNLDTGLIRAFWKQGKAKREIKLGVSYLELLLGGNRYQQDTGVFGEWREQWNPHFLTSLQLSVKAKNYTDAPEYEGYQPFASLVFLVPRNRLLHSISLFSGSEKARNDGEDNKLRDFQGLGYRLTMKSTASLSVYGGISGYWAQYKGDHDVFGEARDDNAIHVNTGVDWKLSPDLIAIAEVGYTENSSNLEIYEYDRTKSEIKLRWHF